MSALGSNRTTIGSLTVFFGASVWGLYWIPLEYFDAHGLKLLWAIAAINICAFVPAIIAALVAGEIRRGNLKWLLTIGTGMGAAIIFYLSGLLLSDVIRVTFLFYLLPLWATLFSWVIFGVAIGRARIFALAIAVLGIWLLLGAGGWPIPKNIGDVFALMSGVIWGFSLTMVRGKENLGALSTTAIALLAASIIAIVMASILAANVPDVQPPLPDFKVFASLAVLIVAFGVIVFWPSLLGQLWGTQFVGATRAALLTMSEIVTATISTYLLASTDMGLVSWIGAGLIVTAIFVDISGGGDG